MFFKNKIQVMNFLWTHWVVCKSFITIARVVLEPMRTNTQTDTQTDRTVRLIHASKCSPFYRMEKWTSLYLTEMSRNYCEQEFILDTKYRQTHKHTYEFYDPRLQKASLLKSMKSNEVGFLRNALILDQWGIEWQKVVFLVNFDMCVMMNHLSLQSN